MTPSELIMHSTIRIENKKSNGELSSGTGFFFNLLRSESRIIPVIVTNKHVIQDSEMSRFHVTIKNENGLPMYGNSVCIECLRPGWIDHPDQSIDLAVLPVGGLFDEFVEKFGPPFFVFLTQEWIWNEVAIKNLLPIEDILIVGYPNGIWDSKNNLPVFRKGITATPIYVDWEGRPEFLVDAAIFPGSSGSPVFLFNETVWVDRNGNTHAGAPRLALLGVIHSVALHTATGEILFEQIPTSIRPFTKSNIPNHLGICVKAEKILDFERYIL